MQRLRGHLVLAVALLSCQERPQPVRGPIAMSDVARPPSDAPPPDRELAAELEAIRAEHALPSLAAAVWRDGKLVELAAVGLRKADDPSHEVTMRDRWHLGSNTKAMTALLAGILVDRGIVQWSDPLSKLFAGEKLHAGYASVTLEQLMRHQGGAPADSPPDLWAQLWTDGDQPDARMKFVRGVLARAPAQPAGTFAYSNDGYTILGAALERAAKQRWETLLRDEVFARLGMTSCGFGAPGEPGRVDQPWGHDESGTPVGPGPNADNPPGMGPAGTVHCSLEDYGKFLAIFQTGRPALVAPSTLEQLRGPVGGYGGGWMVFENRAQKILAHSGSNTMWYATTMVVLGQEPESRWAFAMVTNSGRDTIETVFKRLVKRHLPRR